VVLWLVPYLMLPDCTSKVKENPRCTEPIQNFFIIDEPNYGVLIFIMGEIASYGTTRRTRLSRRVPRLLTSLQSRLGETRMDHSFYMLIHVYDIIIVYRIANRRNHIATPIPLSLAARPTSPLVPTPLALLFPAAQLLHTP